MENNWVRLEPLTLDDALALYEAAGRAGELDLFTRRPDPWTAEGFRTFLEWQMNLPATQPYTVRSKLHGLKIVGSSSFLDIQPAHHAVEIGWTWYGPDYRGTAINPAAKLAMLTRCFETELFAETTSFGFTTPAGPANRVALKTDLRNERSQRAITKLGARREGVLREAVIMHDGYKRSTVMFSILADEWTGVKRGLEERLGSY